MTLSIVVVAGAALAAPAAADPEVPVTGAPPIAAVPAGGLDPDVAARLDAAAAEAAAAAARPDLLDRALDRVLVVYESDDPFSKAQRERALPRSLAILGTIGARARAAGDVELAARAFDARWTLGGHKGRDRDLASALTAWAERDAGQTPAQALYLARRARRADPSFTAAAHLDEDLSTNHRIWPARLAVVASLVAIGVGIYAESRVSSIEDELQAKMHTRAEIDRLVAERDRYDAVGTGLFVAAPVLSIGGILFALSGTPRYEPTSPATLPTVEDR